MREFRFHRGQEISDLQSHLSLPHALDLLCRGMPQAVDHKLSLNTTRDIQTLSQGAERVEGGEASYTSHADPVGDSADAACMALAHAVNAKRFVGDARYRQPQPQDTDNMNPDTPRSQNALESTSSHRTQLARKDLGLVILPTRTPITFPPVRLNVCNKTHSVAMFVNRYTAHSAAEEGVVRCEAHLAHFLRPWTTFCDLSETSQ